MDDLVVEQRPAEHLALARVFGGFRDQALHADHGRDRTPQPLLLELLHLVDEAHAFLADQVPDGHLHFVEEDLRRIGRAHAELVELLHHLHALGLHRQADQRLVLVHRAFARVGQEAHPVGLGAVGGPHLAAVDNVVAADTACRGLERGDVRSGADLRDAQASDIIAGDRRRQELTAQLVAPVAGQCRRRHVGLNADGHRHRTAMDVAEFLGHHQGVGVVEPHAAEFGGLVDAEQAGAAQLLEDLVGWEDAVLFPLVDVRIDVLVDDRAQGAADLGVFLGELHTCSLSSGTAGLRPAQNHERAGGPRSGKKSHRLPSLGMLPISLAMICSITSSAPPPIEPSRPSR